MKIVFIGCGNITNLRHIPSVKRVFRKLDFSVGLIGVSRNAVERASKHFSEADEFVGDITIEYPPDWLKDADLIIIGTPPSNHLQMIRTVLSTSPNAKILCEKPLCVHQDELQKFIREQSEGLNLSRLFVMHNFQFSDAFKQAKSLVKSNRFGKVVTFQGHQLSSPKRGLPDWYEELPMGLFWDECAHFFYLAKLFCEDFSILESSQYVKCGTSTPVQLNVSALSKTDIPITFSMNFSSPISEWGCAIVCERGILYIDMFRDILIVVDTDNEHKMIDVLKSTSQFLIQFSKGFFTSGLKYVSRKKFFGVDEAVRIVLESDIVDSNCIDFEEGVSVIEKMFIVREISRVNYID